MMSQILRISLIALALVASSPVLAQDTATQPVEVAQDDGFDLGWLGLLACSGWLACRDVGATTQQQQRVVDLLLTTSP